LPSVEKAASKTTIRLILRIPSASDAPVPRKRPVETRIQYPLLEESDASEDDAQELDLTYDEIWSSPKRQRLDGHDQNPGKLD